MYRGGTLRPSASQLSVASTDPSEWMTGDETRLGTPVRPPVRLEHTVVTLGGDVTIQKIRHSVPASVPTYTLSTASTAGADALTGANTVCDQRRAPVAMLTPAWPEWEDEVFSNTSCAAAGNHREHPTLGAVAAESHRRTVHVAIHARSVDPNREAGVRGRRSRRRRDSPP